jgi:hypothetical protein
MAIFSRRWLQRMIDELGPWLTEPKARDLINRLDNVKPDQAIPAEYELGVAWALSKTADIEFEPAVGGKTPDLLVHELLPGLDAIVEIAALSDDSLSGESAMRRTANIITQYAERIRPGATGHLYFEFLEQNGFRPVPIKGTGWTRNQYFRERLTSQKFKLNEVHQAQLRSWLQDGPPKHPIRIVGEGTVLVASWKDRVLRGLNVFSSMPSEAHSLTDNPIYRRLKEKERGQLRGAPQGFLKCIVLGDAGCQLLREPNGRDPTNRRVSGTGIIKHFLANSTVDLVAVFSPRRRQENAFSRPLPPRVWHLFLYAKDNVSDEDASKLLEANKLLPAPYLHGYQARSWLEQGMLNPQGRGQYEPPTITSQGGRMTVKISARALLELMEGRLTHEEFNRWALGSPTFEHWLTMGYAIKNVSFEEKGPDSDDDRICFHLELDPNARPLQPPRTKAET